VLPAQASIEAMSESSGDAQNPEEYSNKSLQLWKPNQRSNTTISGPFARQSRRKARNEAIPEPSGDARNHDEYSNESLQLWKQTQHPNTQICEQLARPCRSEANEDMQEQQKKYEGRINRIRLLLNIYFTDSNEEIKDERLPKYKDPFMKLWRLFLKSRNDDTNIAETDEIVRIIHQLCEYLQVDQFDEYTATCVAAHYAFILQGKSENKKSIPFVFLSFLLQACNRTDTAEDNVLSFISQYHEEYDLSYKLDTYAANHQQLTVDYIERCVLMLQLFDRLLEFYTLQYTSVEELKTSWTSTKHAYSMYEKNALPLDFYDFFSDYAGQDTMEIVGTTVDAQSVQALLESYDFPQAVERIVLPLLSARKSKLTLQVHHDLSNAYALQQNWEALNKVLTQLETAGGQAQDEGRRMLQERVKEHESKLHPLVTKICKQYIQMQNVQVLSKQLDSLLESNTHAAASDALPNVFKTIKRGFSKLTSRHRTQSEKNNTLKTFEHVPEPMRQEADNDLEEFNTIERLLAHLRTFCTVTLDEKSIDALETLWHEIRQEFDKLNLYKGDVGIFFCKKNADIPVSAVQVLYFIMSLTFADAVEHIGLVKLVEARIRQPTQRQSTQLAQAVTCTGYLHEQHASEKELLAAQVATESKSYTAIQNAVRGEEARLIGALEQLYEDRQVLPRLLEELKSLLPTHASAAKRGPTGTSPALSGARDLA
jgi:hypothetical protein